MAKIDLKKDLKHLYRPSAKEVVQIDVPKLKYLMIDGMGDPGFAPEYAEAVEALYSVSYTTKFMLKKGAQQIDYAVMPLEGLWWAEDMSAFITNDRSQWKWTMMILQPSFVEDKMIHAAMDQVREKKGLPGIDRMRLEYFTEGLCAQIMHIGPFTEEGPTIEKVHAYIESKSALSGKHHEIYLSDIRRANPKNWKTIIRQPMQ